MHVKTRDPDLVLAQIMTTHTTKHIAHRREVHFLCRWLRVGRLLCIADASAQNWLTK